MDGTLVDSSKVTIRACQETSLEFGFQNIKAEEIVKLIGYPDPGFYYRMYSNLDKDIVNKYAMEVAKKEEVNMCELKEENLFPGVWT
jgi:phosphoglycolate phosphatase-like HAD superfamily hydrolase